MRLRPRISGAVAGLFLLFGLPSPVGLPSAAALETRFLANCQANWTVTPSPNNGTLISWLDGDSALNTTDAWAVGYYRNPSFLDLTLTEHWDGTAWNIISSPNVGGGDANYLYDVDASGTGDAWAVGQHGNAPYKPLIEHWNGSVWSITTGPTFSGDAILYGVAAIASNNAWAVGYQFSTFAKTLIEHWDGIKWSVVTSPSPSTDNNLAAAFALSSSDIWAVGTKWTTSQRPLTLHWDGIAWTEVSSPDPGYQTLVTGVVAVSASDAWAVGHGNSVTYTQHWDGTQWSIVPSPFGISSLSAVTALGTDVWAVGNVLNGSNQLTLVIHWDGTAWSQVSSPSPSLSFDLLLAADSADGQIWAVGTYTVGSAQQTLVETACPASVTITGFSPPAGTVGSTVTITGTGFADVTSVAFNGVASLTFVVDSPTQIRAKVPIGATTGLVSVTTSQGTAQSATSFRVKPKISGFMPTSGPVGTTVTIAGSAFLGATSVTFNGVAALFSILSYSKIRATVPSGATTGPIAVTTPDGQARSRTDFVVT
jgi:hypothetical protein